MFRGKSRLLILLVLLAAMSLIAPSRGQAAEIRSGSDIVIAAGETIDDDLYLFADSVTVHGTVRGDVVAMAGRVFVDGVIEGDLMGAGEIFQINGTVTDDVRVAAQHVRFDDAARVADDALVASYSLDSRENSMIGGELRFASAQALLGGQVARSVWGVSSAVRLTGSVGGDVTLDFGDTRADTMMPAMPAIRSRDASYALTIPVGLTVDESAHVGGNLTYNSLIDANVAGDAPAPVQTVPAVTVRDPAPSPVVAAAFEYLRRVATLLVVGLLLLGVRAAWVRQSGEEVRRHYLHNFGWGLVAFIGFFVVALVLLLGVIGLTAFMGALTLGGLAATVFSLGLFTEFGVVLAFLLVVNYVAQVVVSVMAGRWLLQRFYPAWAERPVAHLVLGVLLLALVEMIPFVGGWVGLLVVLPVLGVIWDRVRAAVSHGTPAPSSPVPPPAAGAPMAA